MAQPMVAVGAGGADCAGTDTGGAVCWGKSRRPNAGYADAVSFPDDHIHPDLRTHEHVDAYLYSAGGIAGAEGSVRLLLDGTDEEVEAALKLVESVKGEPRYLL